MEKSEIRKIMARNQELAKQKYLGYLNKAQYTFGDNVTEIKKYFNSVILELCDNTIGGEYWTSMGCPESIEAFKGVYTYLSKFEKNKESIDREFEKFIFNYLIITWIKMHLSKNRGKKKQRDEWSLMEVFKTTSEYVKIMGDIAQHGYIDEISRKVLKNEPSFFCHLIFTLYRKNYLIDEFNGEKPCSITNVIKNSFNLKISDKTASNVIKSYNKSKTNPSPILEKIPYFTEPS